jgi:hypothetical protein
VQHDETQWMLLFNGCFDGDATPSNSNEKTAKKIQIPVDLARTANGCDSTTNHS